MDRIISGPGPKTNVYFVFVVADDNWKLTLAAEKAFRTPIVVVGDPIQVRPAGNQMWVMDVNGREFRCRIMRRERLSGESEEPAIAPSSLPAAKLPVLKTEGAPAETRAPLTNAEIIEMVRSGVAQDLIMASVQGAPANYRFLPTDLVELKNAGVPDDVVRAMASRQFGSSR